MHPFIKLLTTAILILVLLSAGCTDTGSRSVESPAAVSTATQAATSTPELTPESTENWWDKDPELVYGNHDSSFFGDVEGIKNTENIQNGYYTIMNEDGDAIVKHQEFPNFDLYSELQPGQARALEEQYGYPESVVMEQADTDGDGALDKVAVRYEGSKGVLEFEMDVIENAGLINYLKIHLYLN